MSIGSTGSSYISHDTIDTWMHEKLNDAYSDMRTGMDTSGRRTEAEKALNDIKNQLAQMKTNGKDASEVTAAMHEAITQFAEEFPDVERVLKGALETLDQRAADAAKAAETPTHKLLPNRQSQVIPASHSPEPVYAEEKEIDAWTSGITNAVDGLAQDDQLGLLKLNQLNSHINQTEQIASALIDSRNKSMDSIINRIG